MSFILTKNSGVPVKYLVEGYIENTSDLSNLGTNFTLGSKIYALDTGKAYVLGSNGSWEYLKEGGISPEDLDDYYTKEEVNDLIETQVDGRFAVVDILPTEDIQTNVIYLVPSREPGMQNVRDEYINLTGTSAGWELIGSTQIDLSDYYTKTQVDNKFVEKESGKGLSTNDYTTAEKEKLANVATGAEVNVQANWNETNTSSDAFIQNKPTLGTAAAANVTDFATAAQGTKADNAETKNTQQDSRLDAIEEELVVKKTVSGNIVSVHDAAAYPAEGLEFAIEPVQDLHGYDKPWPAGGGKNLLPPASSSTINGVTFTVNNDGSVTFNGTASGNASFQLSQNTNLLKPNTTYVINGSDDASTTGSYHLQININGQTSGIVTGGNDVTFTTPENITIFNCYIVVLNGNTVSNVTFKPMIRLATDTDPTFVPYSNICPISGWTGVNGERTGKNLLETDDLLLGTPSDTSASATSKRTFTKGTYIVGLTSNNYYIPSMGPTNVIVSENEISYTVNSQAYCVSIPITGLKAGTSYTLSATSSEADALAGMSEYTEDGTWIREEVYTGLTNTITVSENAYYVLAHFRVSSRIERGTQITFTNIQFETGSTATTYEPYQGTSIPITFPTEAGTVYGGKVDVVNGKLTVDRAEVMLNGTHSIAVVNWRPTNDSVGWLYVPSITPNIKKATGEHGIPKLLSNSLEAISYKVLYEGTKNNGISTVPGSLYGIGVRVSDITLITATAINDWLERNPIKIVYELATPIEYDITLQQVQMLLGNNNIWCDTGDTTLTYYSDSTISQLLADLDSRADALENNYLPKTGGALTGDVTTTNSSFTSNSLVPKSYVDEHDIPNWTGTRAEYEALEEPLPEGTTVFITGEGIDYTELTNKPQINGIALTSNKSADDLNLAEKDASYAKTESDARYLQKTGGALTGDVTTSVTTFTSASLVTRRFVEDAIANITDFETEVFPNA